ncbi:hypothetical protein C7999DRAFT_15974 [Corynascus novoguineensis]|uniref:Uncharacterized protein n=1 Tax=Corynascus novoguineensis TaxID=1126955 RepID=A0AAN7CPD3_9PEZI|nr:hypothetical protein C7999DRAFT_15974 [Corynascus novoguineensis]
MASRLESLSKWLQLKIYQLEVTMSVYIYTPIEKFIFYSVLFLLVSLTFIATVLYLPQHLQFIISRAWFYMHGDALESMAAAATKGASVGQVVSSVAGATAAATAESLKEL